MDKYNFTVMASFEAQSTCSLSLSKVWGEIIFVLTLPENKQVL